MQLLRSFRMIRRDVRRDVGGALLRHLLFQVRKTLGRRFPMTVKISKSILSDDSFTGTVAVINSHRDEYEYNNMGFLTSYFSSEGGVFFDIGANIGSYALVQAENQSVRVVAFEPMARTFQKLSNNIRRNARENIIALNCAISDRNGTIGMTDNKESAVNHVVNSDDVGSGAVEVACRTLASVCNEIGLVPDIVKMDIEGHEISALDGFGNVTAHIAAIIVERGERPEIQEFFDDAGFVGPVYFHREEGVINSSLPIRKTDSLFLNRARLDDTGRRLGFEIRGIG